MANKTSRNEQRKLTATFINGVAVALFGVGGLAQIAAMATSGHMQGAAALLAVICVVLAIVLHLVARASLNGMEE